jgi:hypothetical protein
MQVYVSIETSCTTLICYMNVSYVWLVPRNSSRGRGVIHTISRGAGGAVLSAYVSVGTTSLECSVLELRRTVSIPRYLLLVSVDNVFRSGSSSERHHSKRTASLAPQQRLPFRAAEVNTH